MATKLICDRCGAEINPKSSVTYAGMRRLKMGILDKHARVFGWEKSVQKIDWEK